jgi:hypothetical protein
MKQEIDIGKYNFPIVIAAWQEGVKNESPVV